MCSRRKTRGQMHQIQYSRIPAGPYYCRNTASSGYRLPPNLRTGMLQSCWDVVHTNCPLTQGWQCAPELPCVHLQAQCGVDGRNNGTSTGIQVFAHTQMQVLALPPLNGRVWQQLADTSKLAPYDFLQADQVCGKGEGRAVYRVMCEQQFSACVYSAQSFAHCVFTTWHPIGFPLFGMALKIRKV